VLVEALGSVQGPTQSHKFVSGIKRLRREDDHLLNSSAEVKNAWSYTSTPHYVFMEWCCLFNGYGYGYCGRTWEGSEF